MGANHTCVRDHSIAHCWGWNKHGQLGRSENVGDIPNPTPTLVDDADLGEVRQLALGYYHSCALRRDGRVLCWGSNFVGQLGTATNVGPGAYTPTPTLVDDANLGEVRQLALGDSHSCVLRQDGRVLCWGRNKFGQLGTTTNEDTETPTPVPQVVDDADLGEVRQLALGDSHSCALRRDGRVLCWGSNAFGQLGTATNMGHGAYIRTPTLVNDADLGEVRHLVLGGFHSCVLRQDGRVLCWGRNDSGQLGTAATAVTGTPTPTLVDDADLSEVQQLALGGFHSCALRQDGRVLCWGRN
ncbi:MAG TPA: hypothetical protein VFS43_36755 [Polyangiaceae bacterium]|nr:hypothetical protein [Polyangiaceae bacterium]